MIKAIFFDIDGTLLSFKTHKMPDSTREALELLRAKGIKLFIATGRAPYQLVPLRAIFDFEFDGYVTFNGQYCFNTDEVIHSQSLDPEDLKKLVPYLNATQIACNYVELEYPYFNLVNDKVRALFTHLGTATPPFQIENPERSLENTTYQLSIFVTEEEEAELLKHLPNCKAARWHHTFADIIPKDGGKHVGIQKLLDHYGINRTETMAFGDGGNDLDMLQYVGTGIAMGNAKDHVKAVADYVTTSVDDDGIFNALKHFNVL